MNVKHKNIAILFCDILDFDKMLACEQKNILNILSLIFTEFDSKSKKYLVMKIEVGSWVFW